MFSIDLDLMNKRYYDLIEKYRDTLEKGNILVFKAEVLVGLEVDIRVFFFFSVFLYFFVRLWYCLFIRFRLVLGIELFRVFCREVILNVVIFCKKKIIIVNIYKIVLKIIFIKGLRKFWLLRKNK